MSSIAKFVTDPEWHLIEEMLLGYFNPLMTLDSINLNDDAATVKAEVKVRKEYREKVKLFLTDTGLIKTMASREKIGYK